MLVSTKRLLLYLIFLIAFIQVLFVMNGDLITYLYAAASLISVVLVVVLKSRILQQFSKEGKFLIELYLIIGIIAIVRGCFEAVNYWDWKEFLLNTIFIMLLPIISFVGNNLKITQLIFHNYFQLLPAAILVFILSKYSVNSDGFGRFLSPIYFFILWIRYCKKPYRILILAIALASFFSDLEARSNIIRLTIAGILVLFSFFYKYLNKTILLSIYSCIFLIPFVLFSLAYTGIINIFQIDNYTGSPVSVKSKDGDDADLLADTRTFIYKEQLGSLFERNKLWFGESASAGYQSISFQESSLTSKGRASSEVGILNIIMYTGILGGLVFTSIFYSAGFHIIKNANNNLSVSIGMFIAFRWMYSWVEEFTNYDINYFFLWIIIGVCFSKKFAKMNNLEMTSWVQEIFSFNKSNNAIWKR